ncbi:cytochrome c oxidase assembly protein PET191-domain-containing protein, partial [Pyronema omphalodes]
IGAALAACLQNSDCVMIERNKPIDCLREPLVHTLPTRCQQLKKGYGDCKRGLVDMRKRFRGNKTVALTESEKNSSQGQLYGGKPAYQDPKSSGSE